MQRSQGKLLNIISRANKKKEDKGIYPYLISGFCSAGYYSGYPD